MLAYYRGHVIVLLRDDALSAEITERKSGAPLPTKVLAVLGEDVNTVIERAKDLVDIYVQGAMMTSRNASNVQLKI
ncbi:hypothetical protein ABIB57_005256 [Devosia sp. UYZn731]|uniref:hypothetical protein n=1 Tax=Devosia sp. UYZn731 TaxID=3156345 RepID=UPI00339B947E